MIIDKFQISLFNLLESIIYLYDEKTKEIIFINKYGKKILGIENEKEMQTKIPKETMDKLLKDCPLEKNTLISDNQYINHFNTKYLVTRNSSIYDGREVIFCVCNSVSKNKNYDCKILQKDDILIESTKILDKYDDLFNSIYKIMKLLSEYYESDKVYIYELLNNIDTKACSYKWDNKNGVKNYDTNENINYEIKNWEKFLNKKSTLFIDNIQIFKDEWQEKYLELKENNIENIVVVIIKYLDQPLGILCLENINSNKDFSLLNPLLCFVLNEMKRTKVSEQINLITYSDITTGLNNKNKYINYLENINLDSIKSIGIIFLEINEINDTTNSKLNEKFILEVSGTLKKFFRLIDIYRTDNNKFAVICENIQKDTLNTKINSINNYFTDLQEYSISMGYIWRENDINISELLNKVDEFTCKAKCNYYSTISKQSKKIYLSIVTESEASKDEVISIMRTENTLDFEDNSTSFKVRQEIFQYKVNYMLNNPNYKNLVMVMLDVNNFKAINEMYGFSHGNEILLNINFAINSNIAGKGICVHLHSDIYYFCMEILSDSDIEKIINNINYEVNKVNPDTKVAISYGVYKIEDRTISVEEICERVNYAHKISKKDNINKFVFYNEDIKQEMINEKQIENNMEKGIKNDEFKLYLQPKYNIFTENIEGAEALVRWKSHSNGLMFPNKFIPIFEKNGFIMKLDLYMLEQVCKFIKNNMDKGKRNIPISVNMSKLNFKDSNFKDNILNIIKKYNIDPSLIELEITESLIMEDPNNIINVINQLKKENLKISIDDFGTGYSSLSVLQKLPVDILKIDCGFFKNFQINKKGSAIIKTIISLAKELELKVVAEGVEKEEEVQFLKKIGCAIIQGYYFSKPISIEEFQNKMYNA